jgi:replication-associated recombination protein RarA
LHKGISEKFSFRDFRTGSIEKKEWSMSEFMSYDPWANIKTRNGYNGDEMISMLQKSIRRGLEDNALAAAYEMYITSPQFEDKLWRRLIAISVEDIGFGDPMAAVLINTCNQMRKEFPYNDGDRPMFFVHGIRYLCRCQKERSSSLKTNLVVKRFSKGELPAVPEYALDMHTVKGRAMGRDEQHFLSEASRVIPRMDADFVKAAYEEYQAYIKQEKDTDRSPEVPPFEYNTWQF